MKTLQIKTGNAKIEDSKIGFSFDNWVYSVLDTIKTISVTRACCNPIQLKLKTGVITITEYNNESKAFFNIEQWLRNTLFEFGVIDQNDLDDLCCPHKDALFIHSSYIYKGRKPLNNGLDLRKRLKYLLTEWSVSFTDPCCS